MTNLKVEVELIDDKAIIHLEGLLDAHNSQLFEEALKEVILKGVGKVIIDFEKLNYLGSSGLEIILGKVQDLRKRGGDIVLSSMSFKIKKIFDLLGLLDYFKFFDTVEDGIKFFG